MTDLVIRQTCRDSSSLGAKGQSGFGVPARERPPGPWCVVAVGRQEIVPDLAWASHDTERLRQWARSDTVRNGSATSEFFAGTPVLDTTERVLPASIW